jgi:hypothetical protein
MLSRARWLVVGLVAGFGASKWLERKLRRSVARYLPSGQLKAGAELVGRAHEIASEGLADLRSAVAEAHVGMSQRESELRSKLRSRGWSSDERAPSIETEPVRLPSRQGARHSR